MQAICTFSMGPSLLPLFGVRSGPYHIINELSIDDTDMNAADRGPFHHGYQYSAAYLGQDGAENEALPPAIPSTWPATPYAPVHRGIC